VSPGLPARAALHRTTHADTMLTSDSPQLSERDKPGETPNCAAALPLASADASFKKRDELFLRSKLYPLPKKKKREGKIYGTIWSSGFIPPPSLTSNKTFCT